MASVTFKGTAIGLAGELPAVGTKAPKFTLVGADLGEIKLADFADKQVVLNIFPSIDTGICAASVRRFNQEAADLGNTVVVCVSLDLPFASSRFCAAEGLANVVTASSFRSVDFGQNYGLTMLEGPLRGLLARAVVVIDAQGTVVHQQLVPEIVEEPDYSTALAACFNCRCV